MAPDGTTVILIGKLRHFLHQSGHLLGLYLFTTYVGKRIDMEVKGVAVPYYKIGWGGK